MKCAVGGGKPWLCVWWEPGDSHSLASPCSSTSQAQGAEFREEEGTDTFCPQMSLSLRGRQGPFHQESV